MDWQQIVSLIIVALAALLLVRREVVRRRRGAFDCCQGCPAQHAADGTLSRDRKRPADGSVPREPV